MTARDPADLIRQEAELIESGIAFQTRGLELLLAEMRALAGMLPGVAPVPAPGSEAETEASFDNMPV